jgi:pimeloyl-ACP methyl ester carboxylesterase
MRDGHCHVRAFAAGLASDADATLAKFIRLAALNGVRGREAIRSLATVQQVTPPADRESLRATLAGCATTTWATEAALVRVPTLVIHGEVDAVAAPEAGLWLGGTSRKRVRLDPGMRARALSSPMPPTFAAAVESADV